MRVLKVDFTKRTDEDRIPLTPEAVLEGDCTGLEAKDRVLLRDADLEVVAKVTRRRGDLWAEPDWDTVKFL